MACTVRCVAVMKAGRTPASLRASRAGISLSGTQGPSPMLRSQVPWLGGARRGVAMAASSGDDDENVPDEMSQVVFKRRLEMQYLKEKVQDAKQDAQDCNAKEEAQDCAVEWDTVHELQSALDKKSGNASMDLGEVEPPKKPVRSREEELEWRRQQVELNTGFDPKDLPKPTGSLKAAAELEKAMKKRLKGKGKGKGGGGGGAEGKGKNKGGDREEEEGEGVSD